MVIGSRPFSGQGQVVKAHFWPVKDLDPGRGRINRVYGSDPPLKRVHLVSRPPLGVLLSALGLDILAKTLQGYNV